MLLKNKNKKLRNSIFVLLSDIHRHHEVPPWNDCQATRVQIPVKNSDLPNNAAGAYFSLFTSNHNQNGFSRHRGHMLPDGWPLLPGGGAAALWQARGREGRSARRVAPCKRNLCSSRQSPTSSDWWLNYDLFCSPASLSSSCSGQGSQVRIIPSGDCRRRFSLHHQVESFKRCSFLIFTQD